MDHFINQFLLYPNMLQQRNSSWNTILQNEVRTNTNKFYKSEEMKNDVDYDNINI